MVGDSEVDVLTARNANLWSVGVTYGFAPQTLERTHPDISGGHSGGIGTGADEDVRHLGATELGFL